MLWIQRLRLRLRTLFFREHAIQELNDEMHFHLEQQIAENVAAGMSQEEARHSAMRSFGNAIILSEEARAGSRSNRLAKTCAMAFAHFVITLFSLQ